MRVTLDGLAPFLGKIVPPAAPAHLVDRPRLAVALASPRARITVLAGGAGYGKSTALAAWCGEHRCAWYTITGLDRDPMQLARGLTASLGLRVPGLQESLAPLAWAERGPGASSVDPAGVVPLALAGALHGQLHSDLALVVDNLDELPPGPAAEALVGFCTMAPPRLTVILATGGDLPFAVDRLRLRGQLRTLSAEVLRFDLAETEALLDALGGARLRPYSVAVHEMTAGWPAAARMIGEALTDALAPQAGRAPDEVLAELLHRPASRLVDELLDGELRDADPELGALLRAGAVVPTFNGELLGVLGVADADAVLARVARRGVHIEPSLATDGWFSLTPLTREYALNHLVSAKDSAALRAAAARWHTARGEAGPALTHLILAGDGDGVADLLEAHGAALLVAGASGLVLDGLALVRPERRSPALDLVEGEACQIRGEWDRAVGCLGRLIPARGPAPAAAAWRLGLIHHLRGDPARALDLYRRGHEDPAGAESDRALAAAWGASAAWLTGDTVVCRELADAADALARRTGDDRALAAAHTASAMLAALEGDRRSNDSHYLRALDHAQRCGDLLQVIRIRANRGSRFLEEGYFVEALSELGPAVALAELTGFAALRTLALLNRAEALRHLGRLDEASQDYLTGLAEAQRLGTAMAGYALAGLAAVHADQGNVSLAQAGFEEAMRLAEPSGDVQGLVPALAGLARVVMVDNPDAAAAHAARAVALPTSLAHTNSLLASGWVAATRGRAAELAGFAESAHAAARARRDRAGIAEALELRALAADQPDVRRRLLAEAEALWTTLGCPLPLARTRLALARAGGDVDVAEVESTCRRLGARPLAAEAVGMRRPTAAGLSIRTLGGFRVLRDGVPVPLPAWQSRKARDLLKILVARRGVPMARDAVFELLWPEADPTRASARLSVALSTLRAVLDPTKQQAQDAYVASAGGALWLRREAVEIDVETFLDAATTGPSEQVSTERLSLLEATYTGDFCAEDPYADWALALRGETLAAYVAVAGALARRHAADGDHDTAIRYLLRLQAHEPFDERTSQLLVSQLDAAGRHADARRTYHDYAARMTEWDLPAAPYPTQGQRPTPTTNEETADHGPDVPPSVARTRQ